MALTACRAATICGLLLCLAGLSGADGFKPGTLIMTEGGNDVKNATLLVVSQAGFAGLQCAVISHCTKRLLHGASVDTLIRLRRGTLRKGASSARST